MARDDGAPKAGSQHEPSTDLEKLHRPVCCKPPAARQMPKASDEETLRTGQPRPHEEDKLPRHTVIMHALAETVVSTKHRSNVAILSHARPARPSTTLVG